MTEPMRTWRRWYDVTELFGGPADRAWDIDRDQIAHDLRDPKTRAQDA